MLDILARMRHAASNLKLRSEIKIKSVRTTEQPCHVQVMYRDIGPGIHTPRDNEATRNAAILQARRWRRSSRITVLAAQACLDARGRWAVITLQASSSKIAYLNSCTPPCIRAFISYYVQYVPRPSLRLLISLVNSLLSSSS